MKKSKKLLRKKSLRKRNLKRKSRKSMRKKNRKKRQRRQRGGSNNDPVKSWFDDNNSEDKTLDYLIQTYVDFHPITYSEHDFPKYDEHNNFDSDKYNERIQKEKELVNKVEQLVYLKHKDYEGLGLERMALLPKGNSNKNKRYWHLIEKGGIIEINLRVEHEDKPNADD